MLNFYLPTQVLRADQNIPKDIRGFISLHALGNLTEEQTLEAQEGVFHLAQSLSATFSKQPSLFINVMQSDDTRQFALSGGLWGLCKTARHEWDKTLVKCIAIPRNSESPQKIAEKIYREILFGGPETEVFLGVNKRETLISTKDNVSSEKKQVVLHKNDILVVTGGARGITAKCLLALAVKTPCRLLILARTPILDETETAHLQTREQVKNYLLSSRKVSNPRELQKKLSSIFNSREVKDTLLELEKRQCEVLYECVDCTKSDELKLALSKARKHWSHDISGIIHGAGVLHDRLLGEIEREQFRNVFNTKVRTALNLLSETQTDSLKFICFFSSIAARWGNKGQSAYSMGNEVLNKLALYEAEQRQNCVVKSIDWGPWQGGMVNEHLQKVFQERNVGLINMDEGAQAFVDEFFNPEDVEVVIAQGPITPLLFSRIPSTTLDANHSVKELFLEDHTIQSTRVVPFAAVLEWAIRIASTHRPDLRNISLKNSSCFSGILIPEDLSKLSLNVESTPTQSDNSECHLTVNVSTTNKPHYRVHVQMDDVIPVILNPQRCFEGRPYSEAIYDGTVLFHGPQYQTLQGIAHLDKEGAKALIDLSNSQTCRRMLLLDSGIQLAVLWMGKLMNSASLPSSIAKVQVFARDLPEKAWIVLEANAKASTSGIMNLYFQNENQEILAYMEGLLMTSYAWNTL